MFVMFVKKPTFYYFVKRDIKDSLPNLMTYLMLYKICFFLYLKIYNNYTTRSEHVYVGLHVYHVVMYIMWSCGPPLVDQLHI